MIVEIETKHAFEVELDGIVDVTVAVELICPKPLDSDPLVFLIPVKVSERLIDMGILVLSGDGGLEFIILDLLGLILLVEFGDFEMALINIFFQLG